MLGLKKVNNKKNWPMPAHQIFKFFFQKDFYFEVLDFTIFFFRIFDFPKIGGVEIGPRNKYPS
jgi:hypothetical protein